MKERPIKFTAPMVRAILDGRKTQTRRIIKHQDLIESDDETGELLFAHATNCPNYCDYACGGLRCRYGEAGDHLRISEEVKVSAFCEDWYSLKFAADNLYLERPCDVGLMQRIKNYKTGVLRGVHLPPAFSRPLRLEITETRIERLQDISMEDAVAEGIEGEPFDQTIGFRNYLDESAWFVNWGDMELPEAAIRSYQSLWDCIHGPGSWDLNPWLWVIEFRTVEDTSTKEIVCPQVNLSR